MLRSRESKLVDVLISRGPIARLSRSQALALAILVLALVTLGDYLTAWYFIFDFFYLVPLSLTALYVGRRAGIVMAAACTIVWTLVMVAQGHPYIWHRPSVGVLTWSWNFAVRFAVQSTYAWVLSLWRDNALRQQQLISELRAALDQVNQLRSLIPICAWCKKIRDDAGYWTQLDHYLQANDLATFTHGICPECFTKLDNEQ